MDAPERFSLSTELLDAVMGLLAQLPYGQVAELVDAIKADARPDFGPEMKTPDVKAAS